MFSMFHGATIKGVRTETVRNLRHMDHQTQPEVKKVVHEIRDIA